MHVTMDEARNAHLPQEIWHLIFLQLDARQSPLYLRPELQGLLNEARLGGLHATCRAPRKWYLAWAWSWIHINKVKDVKYLLRRGELTPDALELVTVFRVSILWGWDTEYSYDWELCGPPEHWYFADRRDKKKEWLKRNALPKELLPRADTFTEGNWDTPWDSTRHPPDWTSGSDGEGEDSVVKDARTFRSLLEPLLERMTNLHTFHWGTQVIPLSARICRTLAKCKSLQVVSIGPSGQFFCRTFSQSPLWLIFEEREERPLACLYLNIETFPSSRQFKDTRDYFSTPPESLAGLEDCYLKGRGCIDVPDPTRYLQYTYLDDGPEPDLNFVERPLAMLFRTLMASRGRLRHVQSTEIAIARIIQLLPIWTQTAFQGTGNRFWIDTIPVQDEFTRALAQLQPALTALQAGNLSRPSGAQVLELFRSREALHPYLRCLEEDRTLLQKLWEAFLEGREKSLPDWNRRPLQSDGYPLKMQIEMNGEAYIRDLPEGWDGWTGFLSN